MGSQQLNAATQRRGASHIMTVATDLKGGGVERAALRLAAGWIAAGRRVTLVAGTLDGPLSAELPDGIETVVLGKASISRLFALPRIVHRLAPDLLFIPGNHYTSVAAWTRLRLGRRCPPIVGKVSNAPVRVDHGALVAAGHRAWLGLHRHFLDRAVAMTYATARQSEVLMGMTGRVLVIPNPPARAIAGAAMPPLPSGRFVLGVGRLVPQKRWDRLIAALPRLSDPTLSMVILGEGERRGELEAQVAALGLQNRVFLPGTAADPLPVMARAAVLALVSDFEGVPGVLREALSVGTPVVSTRSTLAIDEILTEPALGTAVPLDDPNALVEALGTWLLPDAIRPPPVPPPGSDSAARYLQLFDQLVG